MDKNKIVKFEKSVVRKSIEVVKEGPFYITESQNENRTIVREAAKQALIHNWLRAHNHLMKFRRSFESSKKKNAPPELKFWYGTSNRIIVALDLVYAILEELQVSISSVSENTGLTRQTVAKIVRDAQAGGFVDEDLVPSPASQELMAEQVYALVTGEDFVRFGRTIAMNTFLTSMPVK